MTGPDHGWEDLPPIAEEPWMKMDSIGTPCWAVWLMTALFVAAVGLTWWLAAMQA